MLFLCLLKTIIVKAFLKKIILYFTKNIIVKNYRIRPDIRYPAITGYPAGYSVSGFWISRISGRPDIRQAGYPAKTVSGASLSEILYRYR
jgi:hypothetical protein